MEDYRSKRTGDQIEALLDIVSQGGGGGGEGGGTITEAEITAMGFTKNLGTITEVKMNGTSKGTSGVVDLGTVITEHQDISGKQDVISDLATIRDGASKGATALQSVPSEYVTETELTNKGYATTTALSDKVDKVSGKGLSTEDFTSVLKAKLEGLSNYNDTEISNAVSSLQTQLNTLVSGNANDAINSFNEIIAFLDGVKDTEDLSSIVAAIQQQIAGKQDKIEGLDDINEKLEAINNIVDEDGYLYSNGEKVDMRIARSLLPIGTEVPKNADLNTINYVKVGKYYCVLNTAAETLANCPVSVAFMMDVFNPLSTTLDDETTKEYTYRVRLLTRYDTGQQYLQTCQTTGTAGSWRYNSWYVMPRALVSSKSAQIGSSTQGVYIDSSGTVTKMTYTLGKSVPSNAAFTDTNTKVTSVGNHYTPAENTASQIDAPEGEVVVGIKRDAAGHVVGANSTGLKTINGQSLIGSGNLSIEGGDNGSSSEGGKEVVHVFNEDIEVLQPNKIYIWESVNLEFEIQAIEEPDGDYAEYNAIIVATSMSGGDSSGDSSSPTIILPDNVYWANGAIPDLTKQAYYELSIVYWAGIADGGFNAILTPFKSVE